MVSQADKVFGLLKSATGPGDVFRALSQDPMLLIGLVVIVGLIPLFLRIYLWPQINPFQFNWFSDLWAWIMTPLPPSPTERYPYAKVIYPTYR